MCCRKGPAETVPGVFAPVRVKQRLVVDGGLVRNLPVDLARAMGAEIVIAECRHPAGARLYGRGDVARVETEVSDSAGQRSVLIKATEAEWASSRLRLGLELATDFDDANSFALKLMHVRTLINSHGAELRSVTRIGDKRDFGIQFWQPLGPGSGWYLAPSLQYGSSSNDRVFARDGGGFDRDLPLRGRALKPAVSGFLSVDTRFGPTYLGAGATKDGSRTLYIFLGPIW